MGPTTMNASRAVGENPVSEAATKASASEHTASTTASPARKSTASQGDPEFRFEGPLSTEVKGKQTTFIRVFFKPTSAKRFTGSLTIDTNSEVTADRPNPLTIQLQGDGTNPPDAGM